MPITSADPAAVELERCIEEMMSKLEGPIRSALPPKHWRTKGEAGAVAREAARREAAARLWNGLCVEMIEAEALF
jgi:hypothetical protein